ncbi:MAG: hypothetical protein K2M66_02490, partial [Alistipes sp.]|nr:hypothetical protein [Alistipes sp.]
SANNLLWSYHIWKPEIDPTSAANLLEYKYTNSGTYHVMPIALGATNKATVTPTGTATNDTNAKALGMYYQWGRKDPLGRANSITATAEQLMTTYAGATGTTAYNLGDASREINLVTLLGGENVTEKELNGVSVPADTWMIEYVKKNPTQFIIVDGKYNNDWAGKTNDHLWANPLGYEYPFKATLQQSIFDPCPKGYRVAPRDLWIAFTSTGSICAVNASDEETWAENIINALNINKTTHTLTTTVQRGLFLCYGVNADGMKKWQQEPADFYPTSGYRHRNSGSIANAGTTGYYWCNCPPNANSTAAAFMYFGSSTMSPLDNYHRAFGCTIRCVKAN